MNPRRLIRLYPRRWRVRYGDEFCAMFGDGGVAWRHLPNIAGAAAKERVRARLDWCFESPLDYADQSLQNRQQTLLYAAQALLLLFGLCVALVAALFGIRYPQSLHPVAKVMAIALFFRFAISYPALRLRGGPAIARKLAVGRTEFVAWLVLAALVAPVFTPPHGDDLLFGQVATPPTLVWLLPWLAAITDAAADLRIRRRRKAEDDRPFSWPRPPQRPLGLG